MLLTAINTPLNEVCTRLLILTYILEHHNGERTPLATKICEKFYNGWWHSPKIIFCIFILAQNFVSMPFFRIEKILTTKAVTSGFPRECYVNLGFLITTTAHVTPCDCGTFLIKTTPCFA